MDTVEAKRKYDEINQGSFLDSNSCFTELLKISETYKEKGDEVRAEHIRTEAILCAAKIDESIDRESFGDFPFDYLIERIQETRNRYLRARYADFLWVVNRDHKYAQMAIEEYLIFALLVFYRDEEIRCFPFLERAFQLARVLNYEDRIEWIKKNLINVMKERIENNEPRFVLNLAHVLFDNVKTLTPDEKAFVTDILEEAYTIFEKTNPEKIEIRRGFLELISGFYKARKLNDKERVYKIQIAELFEEGAAEAEKNEGGMARAGMLTDAAIKIYKDVGGHKKKIDNLIIRLKVINEKIIKAMKPHEFKTTITIEEYEKRFEPFLKADRSSIIEFLIMNDNGIIEFEDAIAKAREDAETYVLSFLFPSVVYDRYNNIVYRAVGKEENIEYAAITRYLLMRYQFFANVYVARILNILLENKAATPEDFMHYFRRCGLIETERLRFIGLALEKFFEADYVCFLHIAVIQIEGILRDLLFKLGGNVAGFLRGQFYREKTLAEIVSDPLIQGNLDGITISMVKYLLCDFKGLNIRNLLAHGLYYYEECDAMKSHLVLLILLRLCRYKLKKG